MRDVAGIRLGPVALVLTVPLLATALTPATLDWPSLGRVISAAAGSQIRPRIATDGAGGAIIVWQDSRSTKVNVFAQRVLASGNLDSRWPVDGRALLSDSTALAGATAGQEVPVIVADGTGGAIVAWQDGRNSVTGLDVFVQHILSSGVVDPAWPVNGRALCTAPGRQDVPAIISDGAGGAIVTWMDARSSVTGVDIFAQHVQANGVVDPRWPVNGVALTTATATQARPRIVPDGSGGAIVTWHDFRPSVSGLDIYAQRVTSAGVVDPAWPANGLAVCLAAGAQVNPAIVSDGAGGAVITWEDERDGVPHIFAQRVVGSGRIATGWPGNGRAVCTAPGTQDNPTLTSDASGGAIIVWQDARGPLGRTMFAHHILSSGNLDGAWLVDGRPLSQSTGDASNAAIVEDGAGGAIVSWEEDSFVMVQHVKASGALDAAFGVNGRFVRLNIDFQHTPDIVRSGARNAIVTWSNTPSGTSFDIFAALVEATVTGVGEDPPGAPEVAFAQPSPNPVRSALTFRFSLPTRMSIRLALYDVAGRRVRDLASGSKPAGDHAITWNLRDEVGRQVVTGMYFAKLDVGGRTITRKIATVR
jgi:hypothetical protein